MIDLKIGPYFKKNLKMLLQHEWYIIVTFLVLTISIACIFGIMMKDSFEGKNTIEPVSLNISFDRESKLGSILVQDLASDNLKKLICENSENYECHVIISEDFNNIVIENTASTEARIQVVYKFFRTFTSNIKMHNLAIMKASLSENADAATESVNGTFLRNMKQSGLAETILSGYHALNSFEYFSISILSFTSLLIIYLFTNKFFDEKYQEIISRSLVAPHRTGAYLTGYLSSIFILTVITNVIYISIMRICGLGFKEKLFGIFIIMLFQSLMQVSLAGVIAVYAKTKNSVNAVMILLIMLPAAFGGTFTNIDSVENSVTKVVHFLCPNTLVINSYINYEKSGLLRDSAIYLTVIAVLSIICLCAMYLASEKKLCETA